MLNVMVSLLLSECGSELLPSISQTELFRKHVVFAQIFFYATTVSTEGEFPIWCNILTTTQNNNKYPEWVIEL